LFQFFYLKIIFAKKNSYKDKYIFLYKKLFFCKIFLIYLQQNVKHLMRNNKTQCLLNNQLILPNGKTITLNNEQTDAVN